MQTAAPTGSRWSIRALWGRVLSVFSRAPVALPDYGADYALPSPVGPTYDVQSAMSAYAAFPWVYAAMLRRSGDMAGLPLQITYGRGRQARVLDDHPLLDLLERPNEQESGLQFRQQVTIDSRLTGNHYTALFGARSTLSLVRLHPARLKITPDPTTGVSAYVFDGGGRQVTYPREQILHLRLPSWEDDPRGLYGTGAIGSLHDDLTTDRRASRRTAEIAGRGRPDAIVSPADALQIWDEPVRKEIKARLDALLSQGGSVVLGGPAKVDLPAWSPRDMEFEKVRTLAREAVLAVTGVPPHLVGLPTANYAIAEAQERSYWQMLVAEAAMIESAVWNPLAARFDRRLRIKHDFSGVDVLQEGRTKRLERVVLMVEKLGADPKKAAAYEGLPDLPVGGTTSAIDAPESLAVEGGSPPRAQLIDGRGLFGLPRSKNAAG